jgi:HPt (histidine-containing phosphotransfer) domain-containing protein
MRVIEKQTFLDTFQYFDKPIVVEIIDIFLNEYETRLVNIKKAIDAKDFNSLKFDAHSMKGVIANFVASKPQQFAKDLEMKGAENDGTGLDELITGLEAATIELVEDLKEIRKEFE